MLPKKSTSRLFTILFVFVFLLSVIPFQTVGAVGTRYAKPTATGTGTCLSWANACTLQTALTGAVSGDELWVMAGTHKPTTGSDRAATFQLKSGVAVYGGFAGTETARSLRIPATNLTILSGEIGGAGNSDNSHHVVTGATGAILDGFTITAGKGDGPYPSNNGGGMFNNGSSPTLTNLIFSSNTASNGGGLFNAAGSSPILTNVTFSGNTATYGGGMSNYQSSPILTNVTFSSNTAGFGGGMSNDASSPTLWNVTFSGNTATTDGGGMYNENDSSPILTSVTFSSNTATNDGGGMDNWGGSPRLTNVTFSGNTATTFGGGMLNNGSSPTLTNVTFSSNTALYGGGIYNGTGGNPPIRNTIFWGNTATTAGAQIYNYIGTPIVSDSVVQGGYSGGTNIITADPLLGTLGNYGGFTQTIPLLAGSSAINTGKDTICPATDQRGVARPQGGHCDIGAYELATYTLTITSAHGTVTKNPNQATYFEGAAVQLTATPSTGWSFANWTGGLTGSTNPGSVTIHGNTSVTANYTLSNYQIFLPLVIR